MYHVAIAILYATPLSFYLTKEEGEKEMARTKAMPAVKQETKELPVSEQESKMIPDNGQESIDVPDASQKEMPVPEEMKMKNSMPPVGSPENTVIIGGKLIEIKPTKLKYQRNRTAVFYHIMEMYPLSDILAMGENAFGDGLDGDKKVYDWLVAVTDNEELIRENYDDIDSGTIYKLIEIFRRVNKITEMEEKLKNVKTPGEA